MKDKERARLYPLPDDVKVGPHTYRVVSGNDAEVEAKDFCGSVYGYTDTRTCTVFISQRQAYTQSQETLLHEVLHAILDVTGHAHELEDEDEEILVRRLSPALLVVLQQNPALVEYLTK